MTRCVFAQNCGDVWFCPFANCPNRQNCWPQQGELLTKKQKTHIKAESQMELQKLQNIDIKKAAAIYRKLSARGVPLKTIAARLDVPLTWLVDAISKNKLQESKRKVAQKLWLKK